VLLHFHLDYTRSRYLNPDELPPGAVLVVGSGASGCQIAEELYQSSARFT
jgi:putative flavoprotein involved in K+ transport